MPIKSVAEQRRQKRYAQITQGEWAAADEEKSADTPFSPNERSKLHPPADSHADSSTQQQQHTVVELQPIALEQSALGPLPVPSAPDPFEEEDDSLQVAATVGLQYSITREMLYYAVALLTGTLSSLAAFWFPALSYLYRYRRCSVDCADFVLVYTSNGQSELCPVEPVTASPASQRAQLLGRYERPYSPPLPLDNRMIVFRNTRYVLSPATLTFVRLSAPSSLPCSALTAVMSSGLSSDAASACLSLHGGNSMSIAVPSIPSLLIHEVLHPFFVFQIFSLVLWCFEQYFYFAACVFVIATVSIATTVVETRRRLFALAELARVSASVSVLRDGKWLTLPSSDLVPGDVVQVGTGVLSCDVAILSGSCVVNESMLTGESLPILKSAVDVANKPAAALIGLMSASHTLYSATSVLQLKPAHPNSYPLALVTRTGWSTTKGSLILSILYPTPSSFRFVQQSFKFIGCLFLLSLVGFFISVYQLERLGASAGLIVVRALDLVTIIVPPSLPLALSVGTNYALVALRRAQVCCISPNRINMAGKVRVMCFDKTGQLRRHSRTGIYAPTHSLCGNGSEKATGTVALTCIWSTSHSSLIRLYRLLCPTGTLTSDGMEMKGVREVRSGQFTEGLVESLANQGMDDDNAAADECSASSLQDQRLDVFDGSDSLELELDGDGDDSTPRASNTATSSATSSSLNVSPMLLSAMSCCHSLAVLDGELIGDPLEVQIFRATHATLVDQPELSNIPAVSVPAVSSTSSSTLGSQLVRVLHQYEFQSSLQRMTVICRDKAGRTLVFTKGAPEVIARLCAADSVPHDYTATFSQYARHGYRIIAIAYKQLTELPDDDKDAIRPQLESSLTMLGLILLENAVKPQTQPTLAELQAAKVRCVMVTGDHVDTAVSVANECGLVGAGIHVYQGRVDGGEIHWTDTADDSMQLDPVTLRPAAISQPHKYELAVTGDVFRHLSGSPSLSTLFHRVLLSCVIFARMTPDQKALLLTSLQSLQLYAGMCGDGGNDCKALKAAHVGVSLSSSEASIAAPFTYLEPNIRCVPLLLSEGRSALQTSFSLFRFIAMYSLIQFSAVILAYFVGSVLGNWQYLYQDMVVVFVLTLCIGATDANRQLSVKRPSADLLSFSNLLCVFVHMAICVSFQVLMFCLVGRQSGYINYTETNDVGDAATMETTSLYYFSNFQYLIMAVLFAMGHPWKRPLITNLRFTVWCLVVLALNLALLFSPSMAGFWRSDDVSLPNEWRGRLFAIVLFHLTVSCAWELAGVHYCVKWWKRWKRRQGEVGWVYGHLKRISGPGVKEYHRLRGEFEQGWGLPDM